MFKNSKYSRTNQMDNYPYYSDYKDRSRITYRDIKRRLQSNKGFIRVVMDRIKYGGLKRYIWG